MASTAATSTSVWRGALKRRSRVQALSARGLAPRATSALPATSSQSASAGLTVGQASWMSRSTGTDDDPPISTASPNAAVSTPAVLSAILSSPAQPDGSRRVRSSTPPHRRAGTPR